MVNGLLGKKIGMMQIFDKDGNVIPVSVVEVGPCYVVEIKNDLSKKITIGFGDIKPNKLRKSQLGLFTKNNCRPLKVIKEFKLNGSESYQIGQEIKADLFKPGDFVDVTGISIGKGFQGGMKRWGWSGGPKGHGSMHHRRIGSVGPSADPSRVYRGKTMPGHMGHQQKTIQNLRVMQVDLENNLLLIKGSVPGHKRNCLLINKALKKAFRSLDEVKASSSVKRNPMKQSKAAAKGKK
jgi:large subunit ribosomal protein L3